MRHPTFSTCEIAGRGIWTRDARGQCAGVGRACWGGDGACGVQGGVNGGGALQYGENDAKGEQRDVSA